jgi:hypothetical protein
MLAVHHLNAHDLKVMMIYKERSFPFYVVRNKVLLDRHGSRSDASVCYSFSKRLLLIKFTIDLTTCTEYAPSR